MICYNDFLRLSQRLNSRGFFVFAVRGLANFSFLMKSIALSFRHCRLLALLAACAACDSNVSSGTGAIGSAAPSPVVLEAVAADEPVLSLSVNGSERRMNRAELEAISPHRVLTSTFWNADRGSFEGPLLRDVLAHVGLDKAEAIRVTGLDGFSNTIPRQDWERWPILIASRNDGKPIPVSAKGPLRIIYPRDMSLELQEPVYRLRWVWLIARIDEAAR